MREGSGRRDHRNQGGRDRWRAFRTHGWYGGNLCRGCDDRQKDLKLKFKPRVGSVQGLKSLLSSMVSCD